MLYEMTETRSGGGMTQNTLSQKVAANTVPLGGKVLVNSAQICQHLRNEPTSDNIRQS